MLTTYISGSQFNYVVKTVKTMCADTPSLGLSLGHYLKQLALIKGSMAIVSDNPEERKQHKFFLTMFSAKWTNQFSSLASRRLQLRALNKRPITKDLVVLTAYLKAQLVMKRNTFSDLYSKWKAMVSLLLVRVTIFNKRRITEVEELFMQVVIASETPSPDDDILKSLPQSEKAMAKR